MYNREVFIYENHLGDRLQFGAGIFCESNTLRDYEWKQSHSNSRITGFSKDIYEKSLKLMFHCPTREQTLEYRNMAHAMFERDVIAFQYGRIILNGFYLKCFITEAKNSDFQKGERMIRTAYSLLTDDPFWYRDVDYSFMSDDTSSSGSGLDYEHDYEYDYTGSSQTASIMNSAPADAAFKMFLYGPCINPSVTIGGHEYSVNITLSAGEYVLIDSAQKQVKKYDTIGKETNVYYLRNRESYIFYPIPEGNSVVSWSGDFNFDLTVCEKRGEPEWL